MRLAARLRSSLAWLLVLGICVTAFGLLGSAWAGDDPPAEEGASDAQESAEATADGTEDESQSLSIVGLEQALRKNKGARISMLVLKFVPLGIGFLLLLLWWLKRSKVRAGTLPPPAPVEPTLIYALPAAVGLFALATIVLPKVLVLMLSVGVAVQAPPEAASAAPVPAAESVVAELPGNAAPDDGGVAQPRVIPLWIRLLAVFLSTVPLTILLLLRRRLMGHASDTALALLYPLHTPHPSPAPGPLRAFGLGWWGLCVATAIVVPITLIWVLLLDRFGVEAQAQELVLRVIRKGPVQEPILIAVFGVIVAPLWEETFFRGLLYPALRRSLGGSARAVWISSIIVSALFAASHGSLMAAVPLFALAMVLTWVLETTNSLAACILVHMMHNAATLLPLLIVRFT